MKVFRDPIHNIISFDKEREKFILDLIDAKEMQRLRRVRQLGLSFLTYPGAEHSRFVHSLGVTHLVKRIIVHLRECKTEHEQDLFESLSDNYDLALAAALLHDIGHGPFSHAIEKTTNIKHEKWTVLIIKGNTEVHDILENHKKGLADKVANIITRVPDPGAIVKLLSSQLDADRLDYLFRDSFMTGAGYGQFDIEWLINVITVGRVNDQPEIGLKLEKGLNIAEDFVMARYYMYRNVYFHKATRSAELIVKEIFSRATELISKKELDCPPEVKWLLSGEIKCSEEELSNYIALDDNIMWSLFIKWANHGDPLLADLCDRIVNRRLLKGIDIVDADFSSILEKHSTLCEIAKKKNPLFENLILWDNPNTSAYNDEYILTGKENNIDDQEATEQIYLFDKKKNAYELSNKSKIINNIRNQKLSVQRLYYPAELHKAVMDIFN